MPVEFALALSIAVAMGVHQMLQRSLMNVLFGIIILSNAVNLLILGMSGSPTHQHAPILENAEALTQSVAPLPQALILTAIVISFAATAYFVTLLYRVRLDQHTLDLKELSPQKDSES